MANPVIEQVEDDWPDGRKYDGGWMDGKQHGVGYYTNANGIVQVGQMIRLVILHVSFVIKTLDLSGCALVILQTPIGSQDLTSTFVLVNPHLPSS